MTASGTPGFPEFLDTLPEQGALLLTAAEKAGLAADVPSCPGWRVRDLVKHQGTVHRRTTAYLTGALRERIPLPDHAVPDGELAGWYEQGLRELVRVLGEAPEDLECFTLFSSPTAPSGREFWARRQTHETTVHRADAELAAGEGLSTVRAGLAMDGIDELVSGFHTLPMSRVRGTVPCTLRLRATDAQGTAGGSWTLRISDGPLRARRDAEGPADCTLAGPAETLFLTLWNRLPPDAPALSGDRSVAELWRATSGLG